MKKLLFLASISLLSSIAFSQTSISEYDAKDHVGDSVRILGIISFTEHKEKEKKSYAYFGNKPAYNLAVIISDDDLIEFPIPLKSFTNKICVVIGKIVLINKKPAIIVHSYNEFAPGPGQ